MKREIFVILMAFHLGVFGQKTTGEIHFEERLSFGKSIVRNWVFYFDKDNSLYELKNSSLNVETKNENETIIRTKIDLFYYSSAKDKLLVGQKKSAATPYLVHETIPEIDWVLETTTKTIAEFTCQKATGKFRGRTYTIWFTKDIPIQSGPWKLFGAPGAILEYYDETGQIYCAASSIELNEKVNVTHHINKLEKKGKSISINEFVKIKNNESEEILKMMLLKLGREAKIHKIEPLKRQGYELIYEWEID